MRLHAVLCAVVMLGAAAPAVPPAEPVGAFQLAYPFPSPDGSEVVVQANFDGRWQLYVMKLADGALRRLHVSERDDTHPAWSPDGRRIAFISNRGGDDDVYVLDLASGAAAAVAPHPGKDGHPKWSADGRAIVFNRTFDPADRDGDLDSAILRVGVDGAGLQVLSDTPQIETFASLSPDGRSLVFIEWFPDAEGRPGRNGDIVVLDLASGRRRNLTSSPGFDGHPYWGPTGRWIYWSRTVEGSREMVLHRVSPAGGPAQALTAVDGVSEIRALPLPGETAMVFNRTEGGRTLVFRAPLPGG